MNTVVTAVAAALGRHSAGPPFRVALDVPGQDERLNLPRAIYLAYTAAGELHYIGKVDRLTHEAVAQRLREHLRSSRRKRSAWRWLWVVPVADTFTATELLELERTLIRLHGPAGNVQHVGMRIGN